MVFGLAAIVNPHVEAHRLLREQARHKKRLAEIAGQKAVTVTTWDRGAPTDHKASYGHSSQGGTHRWPTPNGRCACARPIASRRTGWSITRSGSRLSTCAKQRSASSAWSRFTNGGVSRAGSIWTKGTHACGDRLRALGTRQPGAPAADQGRPGALLLLRSARSSAARWRASRTALDATVARCPQIVHDDVRSSREGWLNRVSRPRPGSLLLLSVAPSPDPTVVVTFVSCLLHIIIIIYGARSVRVAVPVRRV